MSTLGKIMVVLIAVFSVAFAMMAATGYATRADWQDKYKKQVDLRKKAELATAAAKKAQADAIDVKKDAERDLSKAQETFKTKERALQVQLAESKKNENLSRGKEQEVRGLLKVAQENEEAKRKEADDLRKQLNETRADLKDLTTKQVVLQDSLADHKFKLQEMQKKAELLLKDLKERTTILEQAGLPTKIEDLHQKARPIQPPKAVRGLIKSVDKNYVLVSIGADDQLKKGHTLDVFRLKPTPKFVGKLQAMVVKSDEAVCKILTNYLQDVIKEGDHVETATQ